MKREPIAVDDDAEYRDYLVGIVVEMAWMERPAGELFDGPPYDPFAIATAYLHKRFKQDFTTLDNTVIGANVVAIQVITSALKDDFGLADDKLPVRAPGTSDRGYLDQLIALSGENAGQLSSRYRIDLSRTDLETTTPVRENILTLQSSFRDDPPVTYSISTDATQLDPRVPVNPFFLYKEEWRLRFLTPFFPENLYAFKSGLFRTAQLRTKAEQLLSLFLARPEHPGGPPIATSASARTQALVARFQSLLRVHDLLVAGHSHAVGQEYDLALDSYSQAADLIRQITRQMPMWIQVVVDPSKILTGAFHPDIDQDAATFRASLDPTDPAIHLDAQLGKAQRTGTGGQPINLANRLIPDDFPYTAALLDELARRYDQRSSLSVTVPQDLSTLENLNVVTSVATPQDSSFATLDRTVWQVHDQLVSLFPHVMFLLLPVCMADVLAAKGDFVAAAVLYSRALREHLLRADLFTMLPPQQIPIDWALSWEPRSGDLPWSWAASQAAGVYRGGSDYEYLNQDCEVPFIKIRLGSLYLDWGNQLYRADDEADVFRARELFKAALNELPPPGFHSPLVGELVALLFGTDPRALGLPGDDQLGVHPPRPMPWPSRPDWVRLLGKDLSTENPVIAAERTMAQIGIAQIDAGRNFYGYSDDMVPGLRFDALLTAAKAFTALAKQAEADWIAFTSQAEATEAGDIAAAAAVRMAALRVEIESQHVLAAQDKVTMAAAQVAHIEEIIKKKDKEISDHNSFSGQLGDFVGGIGKQISGVPSGVTDYATNYVKSDAAAAYQGGEAASSAGAGVGVVGAIIAVSVMAGVTFSGMADAANARVAEAKDLKDNQLGAAKAQLSAQQHELAAAQMQQAVASLQASLAGQLLRYGKLRALSAEAWARMAIIMRDVLRRYLDLSTRTAWLAERALSYQQDRDIRIIRFDYLRPGPQGILAADLLQSDVGRLEAEALVGLRDTQPIKWTFSMSRDFPLEFGQLLATGRCLFRTTSLPLELAYPGSFDHRVRAVEVAAFVPAGQVPRGTLVNFGLSVVQDEPIGQSHVMVRDLGNWFLSEFTLKDDAAIYSLPSDSLLAFEGTGIDTLWELILSPAVSSATLASLIDVWITVRLNARFSFTRRAEMLVKPQQISRTALFPAKALFPDAFQDFVAGHADLVFDIKSANLPVAETGRQVTNVGVFFLGDGIPEVAGRLSSATVPQGASFTTIGGLAHSNLLPQPAATQLKPPASSLDPLATGAPDQRWSVRVDKNGNPKLKMAALKDVWLGIEYSATPAFPGS